MNAKLKKKEPYAWQKNAIQSKRLAEFFMLNASCGLGKTFALIEIIKMHSNPKIIIAPKNLCNQWKDELIEEGIEAEGIWVFDQPTMSRNKERYQHEFVEWARTHGNYLIVPTQAFGNNVKQHKKKTIDLLPFVVQIFLGLFKKEIYCILDESSWIKANQPGKKQLSGRSQMIQLLGNMVNNRAAATGTMMSKSPMNVYDQFNFLQKGFFPESRQEFFQRYTIVRKYYYSGRTSTTAINKEDYFDIKNYLTNKSWGLSKYTGKDVERDDNKLYNTAAKYNIPYSDVLLILESTKYWPYKNLEELYARMEPFMITAKREDVFDISHDKFVYDPIIIPVVLSAEQTRLYKKLVTDGFSEDFYLGKAQAAELNIRLQDICIGYEPLKNDEGEITYRKFKENPKLNALFELIEEIDAEEQIVVWCSRTNALDSITERLEKENISYVSYSGANDVDEKKEAERLIKNKEVRVFVANITSGGFGLNALKNINYIIWYCTDDSPEKIHQAQHRILRGQSKTPKFAYALLCEKTVELKQFDSNKNGEEFIKFRNSKEDFFDG